MNIFSNKMDKNTIPVLDKSISKNTNTALEIDSDDKEKHTSSFFTDLKNSPSLRIVTLLLIITLAFFLGMRYLDYKNTETENEYSLEFLSATEEIKSETDVISVININTADKFELMQLKGIGEAKAEAIIDHRNNVGQFNSIDDILNVKGIGNSIFESIKNYITV